MALTLSGTNGVVGAGFTVDASGVSVTAGVGTFGSLAAPAAGLTGALPALNAASLTQIPAANIVGVCTSGLTKTGGFGKILQIGYGFSKSHFQSSSTSYVDCGITTSITPASTSNRILIQMNYLGGLSNASAGDVIGQVRILRGVGGTDTEIFTERTADFQRYAIGGGPQVDYMIAGQFLQNLDYPSTTSEITYKLQTRTGGSGTLSVWAGSNISVMEVTP